MLEKEILNLLECRRELPHRPVWGEIFVLLYELKRESEKELVPKIVYKVQGNDLVYKPDKRKFILDTGEIIFSLNTEELTTSILQGRFLPS